MVAKSRPKILVGMLAVGIIASYCFYAIEGEEEIATPPMVEQHEGAESPTPKSSLPSKELAVVEAPVSVGLVGSDLNGERVGEVRVDFPNGASVDVNLIQFVPPQPTAPTDGPLSATYDRLAEAAGNGDGASARWLHRGLRSCIGAFANVESMDSSIAEMRRTGHLTYPDGRVEEFVSDPQALGLEEIVREQFENCSGISQQQIHDRGEWLELAAKAEDFLAMRDYAVTVLGLKTPEGFELFKKTWDDGHLGSASAMAIFYRNGAPAELNHEPDWLTSYAYTLLSNSVYKSVGRAGGDPNGPSRPLSANEQYAMDQLLSQKGGYLTPAQVEEAEHLAVSLLLDNEACCRGNWLGRR